MKANELRVGNWIFDETTERQEQVWGIKPDRRNHVMVNDTEIEAIQPIPLTEDWLLRFGFELSGRSLKMQNFGRFIFTELGCSFYPAGYLKRGLKVDVQYVHQLQNLYFALTGNELTLNK